MNISEVAKRAGVAKSTVSSVLSGKRYMSPETTKKVLKACEELNYTPNYFASNIMNAQTNIIGLFLEMNNKKYYSYYNDLLEGCITQAHDLNLQILPYFSPDLDKINISLMPGKSPLAGAIVLTPAIKEKRILKLESIKIPCVVVGSLRQENENFLSVDINNRKLVTELLLHLRDNGHRKIGFINSLPSITITDDRDKSIDKFLQSNPDCRIYRRYCVDAEGVAVNEYKSIMLEHGEVTAIVVSSDLLAKDLYEHFESIGKKVGEDISIVALGGTKYSVSLMPKLTCGYQNYLKIGSESIKLLQRRIQEGLDFYHMFIDSDIRWGNSVKKL